MHTWPNKKREKGLGRQEGKNKQARKQSSMLRWKREEKR